MLRSELATRMDEAAALFYAMALTAFRPKYRARLFAIARYQRLKAMLAWCGIPGKILRALPGPDLCDKALLNKIRPCLEDFRLGRINMPAARDILLKYFGAPMADSDYLHAYDYIEKMLKSLAESGEEEKRCAMEIASVIEVEHDTRALRAAKGSADISSIRESAY